MSQPQDLWTLQNLDLNIIRLNKTLMAMPQVQSLKQVAAARKKVASELTHLMGKRKDLEMEIEENQQAKASYEEEVSATKQQASERTQNYRAINDLEAKLSSLAKRIEKVDFVLVELNDELNSIKAQEAKGTDLLNKLDAKARLEKQSYDEHTSKIREDIAHLEQESATTRTNLDAHLLDNYDAAVKRFNGLAVEFLEGNTPSVCRIKLQASAFGDLMRGPDITECPYCHRILITKRMEKYDVS